MGQLSAFKLQTFAIVLTRSFPDTARPYTMNSSDANDPKETMVGSADKRTYRVEHLDRAAAYLDRRADEE
jgi:hypothetical protein